MSNQLIIISNFNFQAHQGAAFSRLYCYAKALEKSFIVYITTKDSCTAYEFIRKETIQDNFFLLKTCGGEKRNKLYRLLFRHFDFPGAYKYLKNINQVLSSDGNTGNAYLFYGSELALTIVALFYLKAIKRKKVFIEKSELEIGIVLNQSIQLNLNGLISLIAFPFQFLCSLTVDLLAPFFSGIIVISRKLERFYGKFSGRMLYVPIINSLFKEKTNVINHNEQFLICYTGTISKKKDGLFEFIKALGTLPEVFRDSIVFNIYGEGNEREVVELKKMITSKNIENIVNINSVVPAKEIPAILSRQNLLVLTRSSNIQTEFGFSTKLVEYLASEVPVLITKVSDNSIFFEDGINALVVDPGDIKAIALKIQYAIQNRSVIKEIGKEGRRTAEKYFYYGLYSEKLKEFFIRH